MTKRKNHIIFVKSAGYGETPVPTDALFRPGEVVTVGLENYDNQPCDVVVVAVVPAFAIVEYAMADQAVPKQERPLTIRDRDPFEETVYVFQYPFREDERDDGIRLHRHSNIVRGVEKAKALNQE